ncbi:calponin-like protein [Cordyceps fumosorosea ARSEF 2679]|uniref:Calponin-like protein n=1 Tax=Cordyceps fumosorosea (strain ARSEF 2679) TaxID=1081104 RepID=A0A167W0I0_CORFA|nr:calponin-like protein [Cordyceps fumosorosea ARSEF 2679]OAA63184.1 calponin-like protein [Cordyceps fumosorosea ARSEF 2679]
MASVSSLDKDLRKMRLDKYTPAAANEARTWVEESLGERLSSPDLLEALKDGVALCKLINLAIPAPGIKFKQSAMPFVQMENISHFLRACQSPPLNLHEHDIFLTVDLYEQKDPAQVLQCLGAFSRAANSTNPKHFPNVIGPRSSQPGGAPSTPIAGGLRGRGTSVTSNTSSAYSNTNRSSMLPSRTGDSVPGRWSPTKSPTRDTGSPAPVSSWSKKEQENASTPAWNISQYGYLGGASQGNLGIQFGSRRQIINSGPRVPSLAEKERIRKEQAAEEERLRQEEDQQERERLAAEEAKAKKEEEERWEAETRQLRQKADDEKRRWEEEERQWKLTEERRKKEEAEAEAKLEEERQRARSRSPVKLRGQYLSQYQADRGISGDATDDSSRIRALEKELEKARRREAEYERERQGRGSGRSSVVSSVGAFKSPPTGTRSPKARSRSRPRAAAPVVSPPMRQDSWAQGEREYLHTQWNQQQQESAMPEPVQRTPKLSPHNQRTPEPRALAVRSPPPPQSARPLPDPTATIAPKVKSHNTGGSSRPLPDPATYQSPPTPQNRTGRFLASNPAPASPATPQTYSREVGSSTEERDAEDRRRQQGQANTKAGGWAGKSLLEREMEMERERQREWEEAQKETAARTVPAGDAGVDGIGGGIGGRWDVGQWSGYTGGDSQNRGSQGIGAGRRQIVGPRPLPGANR